ncbi:hypothetical protein [Treponema pedis]|uniref:hypothetical protein n=1 Tax=Treponema pedis TaxID=409322 RepID=UPI003133EADE
MKKIKSIFVFGMSVLSVGIAVLSISCNDRPKGSGVAGNVIPEVYIGKYNGTCNMTVDPGIWDGEVTGNGKFAVRMKLPEQDIAVTLKVSEDGSFYGAKDLPGGKLELKGTIKDGNVKGDILLDGGKSGDFIGKRLID